MKKLIFLITLLLIPNLLYSAPPTRTPYVSGTTIDPSAVNTNEDDVVNYLNAGVDTFVAGSIGTASIATGGVTSSNILDGTIASIDISSSASIADSKLATISTAGKVSGAAITAISSLPSAAGYIPTANLGSGSASSSTYLRGDQTYATPSAGLQNSRILYTGGNFTTTSVTFTDVDATNASITMTTGANPVLIGIMGSHYTDVPNYIYYDITIDSVRQGQTGGLCKNIITTASTAQGLGFVYQSAALTAGSHTIRLQWKVDANTATLVADTSVSPFHMWVTEVSD